MNANTKGLIQGANHKNLWVQLYVKLWSQEETRGRLREEPKSLFISHFLYEYEAKFENLV